MLHPSSVMQDSHFEGVVLFDSNDPIAAVIEFYRARSRSVW